MHCSNSSFTNGVPNHTNGVTNDTNGVTNDTNGVTNDTNDVTNNVTNDVPNGVTNGVTYDLNYRVQSSHCHSRVPTPFVAQPNCSSSGLDEMHHLQPRFLSSCRSPHAIPCV